MTWLARLHMPLHAALKNRLTDTYAWHELAWKCFPGEPEATRDFLTRLDALPESFRLYILAAREPRKPDWCQASWWSEKQVAPSFLEHATYRFDLVANPTRKVHAFTPAGERLKNSRRLAILDHDAQLAWLAGKASNAGFRLMDEVPVTIGPPENHTFSKSSAKASQRGTHIGVRFQGALAVEDRAAFVRAFHAGLGSARAFGFGMLMLTPLR